MLPATAPERQLDAARDLQLQRLGRVARPGARPGPETADRRCGPAARRPDVLRERGAIQSRRHDQEPQVGPQRLLDLQAQGEPQIGVQRALVKLVEDDGAIGLQRRITLQVAGQQALGDDFDPGGWAHLAVEAHGVADSLAEGFAQELGHPCRGRSRGQPTRLEHQDLSGPRAMARPGDARGPAWSCRRQVALPVPRPILWPGHHAARAGPPRRAGRWEVGVGMTDP